MPFCVGHKIKTMTGVACPECMAEIAHAQRRRETVVSNSCAWEVIGRPLYAADPRNVVKIWCGTCGALATCSDPDRPQPAPNAGSILLPGAPGGLAYVTNCPRKL